MKGCAKRRWVVWKIIVKEYYLSFGVKMFIIMEVVKKFYSYVKLYNVSIIYSHNMMNYGISIFAQFF